MQLLPINGGTFVQSPNYVTVHTGGNPDEG